MTLRATPPQTDRATKRRQYERAQNRWLAELEEKYKGQPLPVPWDESLTFEVFATGDDFKRRRIIRNEEIARDYA